MESKMKWGLQIVAGKDFLWLKADPIPVMAGSQWLIDGGGKMVILKLKQACDLTFPPSCA